MSQADAFKVLPVPVVCAEGGIIHKVMSDSSEGYVGFAEAYFTSIDCGVVRAWKYHKEMMLNLFAVKGVVRVVLLDSDNIPREHVLAAERPERLIMPSKTWFGFQGLDTNGSQLLNISNIKHDPSEMLRASITDFNYTWAK